MPGVPSIYYGSEWALEGRRTFHSDRALRPQLDLPAMQQRTAHPRLAGDIARLASLRASLPALRHGAYRQLFVAPQQFAFGRFTAQEYVVILLNASDAPVGMEVKVPANFSVAVDLLNGDERFPVQQGLLKVGEVPACWGRVLQLPESYVGLMAAPTQADIQ
jgi:glycosidase